MPEALSDCVLKPQILVMYAIVEAVKAPFSREVVGHGPPETFEN